MSGITIFQDKTEAYFSRVSARAGLVVAERAIENRMHVLDFHISGITEDSNCIIGLSK